MGQGEFHIIVDQSQLLELLHDVAQFHLIGLEELATRRHIEEDVLDHEIASHGTHIRFLTLTLRRVNHQSGTQLGIMATGAQFHLGDGGN